MESIKTTSYAWIAELSFKKSASEGITCITQILHKIGRLSIVSPLHLKDGLVPWKLAVYILWISLLTSVGLGKVTVNVAWIDNVLGALLFKMKVSC